MARFETEAAETAFSIKKITDDAIYKIAQIEQEIDAHALKCKKLVVSRDSLDNAILLAKQSKLILDTIEKRRKELTAPINDAKKEIDAVAKKLTASLENATKELRAGILKTQSEINREREIEEARVRAEMEALEAAKRQAEAEARAKAEAEAARLNRRRVVKEEPQQEIVEVDTELENLKLQQKSLEKQSSNTSKTWTFEIMDANAVPMEYLTVDESKIKAAIKNGVRDIAGVKIFQKETLNLR